MKVKIILSIVIISLLAVIFLGNRRFNNEIDELKIELDSIIVEKERYEKIATHLSEIKKDVEDDLKKTIKTIKNEETKKDSITNDVIGLDELELDSFLSEYKHPDRN